MKKCLNFLFRGEATINTVRHYFTSTTATTASTTTTTAQFLLCTTILEGILLPFSTPNHITNPGGTTQDTQDNIIGEMLRASDTFNGPALHGGLPPICKQP